MSRDSFVFYRSFYEAIKTLGNEDKALIYDSIFEYALNQKLVSLKGVPQSIFTLIKPQLDANYKRFLNGKQPKHNQTQSKQEAKSKQTRSKTVANANVNDNVNDNVNVNVNVNENDTYAFFQNAWSEFFNVKLLKLSNKRKTKLKARLKQDKDFKIHFEICLQKIKDSDFLSGKSSNWKATFDWLISNDNNYIKVLENQYANNKNTSKVERNVNNAREYIESINS